MAASSCSPYSKVFENSPYIEAGKKKSGIARQLKISRETLYRYLRSKDSKNPQKVNEGVNP